MKELGNVAKQEGGDASNRVENSYLPFRRRERATVRFRQMTTVPKVSAVHAALHNTSTRTATALAERHTKPDTRPL